MAKQSNQQLEAQLLAEWLTTLPPAFAWKTHLRVGAVPLLWQGNPLTEAQRRAFEVWNDWADARVVTPRELWVVEAKIVGTAAAYGQVLDYAREYPASLDARAYVSLPVRPLVLCAFEKPNTAAYFATLGVRTIVFTPAWAGASLINKIHHAA